MRKSPQPCMTCGQDGQMMFAWRHSRWRAEDKAPRDLTQSRLCPAREESVQALREHVAANALVMALDRSGFLALALGGGLFIKLASAQIRQQAEFFNRALEAAQGNIEGFVFFDANRGHCKQLPFSEVWARTSELQVSA